jgi:peptidoglycan-N-acetylglucosamine deacetylase
MPVKLLFLLLLLACTPHKVQPPTPPPPPDKPKVSFTFDDGITNDLATYRFEDWNAMILSALHEQQLKAVFFVTGSNKHDAKGHFLLNSWAQEGHRIANHSYTHPNFGSPKKSVADFESELLKTDSLISKYATYSKLFRFPYLKEGEAEAKIKGIRAVLQQHGYRNGYVTIDASDWFVNSELIKSIQKNGLENAPVAQYRDCYLQHILDRANYYETLSYQLHQRHIPHTLLLHHNLSSALFLKDLIQQFKAAGWDVVDADKAFEDAVYQQAPLNIPAGESLIWALAKASGKYEQQLRYPAEDSRYEAPKMEALGLIVK